MKKTYIPVKDKMESKPYIINIQNISGKDLDIILLNLTSNQENNQDFDDLGNLIFDKKIKVSCGNNNISFKLFYDMFSKQESVIVSKIKIISSNINQQNQEYCIVRTKDKSTQHIAINKATTDFILNNEIYLKTKCFFKDTIITILFYPK